MKKARRWSKVETKEYCTRHLPVVTEEEMDRVARFLGKNVTREMVLAVALEYGLSVMVEKYLILLKKEEAGGEFKKDFETLFGEGEKMAVDNLAIYTLARTISGSAKILGAAVIIAAVILATAL